MSQCQHPMLKRWRLQSTNRQTNTQRNTKTHTKHTYWVKLRKHFLRPIFCFSFSISLKVKKTVSKKRILLMKFTKSIDDRQTTRETHGFCFLETVFFTFKLIEKEKRKWKKKGRTWSFLSFYSVCMFCVCVYMCVCVCVFVCLLALYRRHRLT